MPGTKLALGLCSLALTAGATAATLATLAATTTTAHAGTTSPATLGGCYTAGTERLILASDNAMLYWESDGDLALYTTNSARTALWTSGTAGSYRELCIGADGDLSVNNYQTGAVLWSRTSSYSGTGAYLSLDSGCDLTAKGSSGTTLWTQTGTCPGEAETTVFTGWCADTSSAVTLLENDLAELRWLTSGNLVMYANGIDEGEVIWQSGTAGAKLCFNDGGQLAVYNSAGSQIWQSNAAGDDANMFTLGLDDCSLVVNRWDTGALSYDSNTACPQPTETRTFTVYKGTSDVVLIESAEAELAFTTAGKLVLRGKDGVEHWASHTSSTGNRVTFQSDGNLVVYPASGTASNWHAYTVHANEGYVISLDGCKFEIKTAAGATVFWRGTTDCSTTSLAFNGQSWKASGETRILQTSEAFLNWQPDGNLCLYTASGQYLWCSMAVSSSNVLTLESDGDLVVAGGAGYSVTGKQATTLELGDDCTLTMKKSGTTVYTLNAGCTVLKYAYEKKVGNSTFGTSFSASLTGTSGTSPKLEMAAGLDVTVFGITKGLLDAYAAEYSSGSNTATLQILGQSVSLNYEHEQTFFDESKTFMLGPVPVTVSAGVTGTLSFAVTTGTTITATPGISIDATLSAGLGGDGDFVSASAGIRGTLNLIDVSLPVSMNAYLSGSTWKYTVTGTLEISTLSGVLALYAEASIDFGFFEIGADYSYDLFSWEGLSWSDQLFSKTGSF